MPATPTQLMLPLLLAGVSQPLEASLRRAGIAVVTQPAASARPAAATGHEYRFVLFDSRSEAGRRAARKLSTRQTGMDAGRLLGPGSRTGCDGRLTAADQRAFWRQLKSALEQAGGVWVRIAELPYPYRSVRCGRRVAGADHGGLTWSASPEEFLAWCSARSRLSLTVADGGEFLHVECAGAPEGAPPAMELWRGRHVAVLPVSSARMSIRESGPVFLRAEDESRAGLPDEEILKLWQTLSTKEPLRRAA